MTFRVVRTNQYNQDLGLIHSTNGNHLESPKEGSSIDHQVTIYLHAQNITMFPTNETWYFASQILVSNSGGLILILTAQSTRNMFRALVWGDARHHERLLKQIEELRLRRDEEKKALEVALEATLTRSKGEINILRSKYDHLKGEHGFYDFLAHFRANGYSDEEHPASFINVVHALEDVPENIEVGIMCSGGATTRGVANKNWLQSLSRSGLCAQVGLPSEEFPIRIGLKGAE
ncbi:xylem cysteine protein 1-like [Dorcoceras hygrometricum]|uniref:Xylem cysteine protein 1-like n=1 Tax=Dorcoceras hygrometricum TaxID=472368 RepID=A0A2Z7AEL8_9LAMI|nr:xylem cysteine protein 1-like [Dorcoceras hygrometricum]